MPQTLQISNTLSHLTIEACGGGATLAATPGSENLFNQGLVTITGASNITLRSLTFKMPALQPLNLFATLGNFDRALAGARDSQPAGATASIAIRPIDCESLTVENCTFNYPLTVGRELVCAGVFAGGECIGLQLQGNQFNGPANFVSAAVTDAISDLLVCGYVQLGTAASVISVTGAQAGTVTNAVLDDACFRNNTFQNLFFPVLVLGSVGSANFDANSEVECPLGIYLSVQSLAEISNFPAAQAIENNTALNRSGLSQDFIQAAIPQTVAVAASYPLPSYYRARNTIAVSSSPASAGSSQPARTAAQLVQNLSTAAAAFPSQLLALDLRISNNDFNTVVSSLQSGGTAVMIVAKPQERQQQRNHVRQPPDQPVCHLAHRVDYRGSSERDQRQSDLQSAARDCRRPCSAQSPHRRLGSRNRQHLPRAAIDSATQRHPSLRYRHLDPADGPLGSLQHRVLILICSNHRSATRRIKITPAGQSLRPSNNANCIRILEINLFQPYVQL